MIKRELSDFGTLSAAEMQIRDEIGAGETVVIGNGKLPDPDAGPERQVRGDFIRYLMLGGCDGLPGPVPETGVRISGALITGVLDLEVAKCPGYLGLFACRFEGAPVLRSARLGGLFLNGSALPGLVADRLEVRGGVFLDDVQAVGEIRLVGAKLGDNLECDGAQLKPGENGRSLTLDGAQVIGSFILRDNTQIGGVLDMTAAVFGTITDEESSWPGPSDLVLDRCRYGAFTGQDITTKARMRWLDLQNPALYGQEFWPQPWVQCAKVLREMGHASDARAVLIDMERRQRWAMRHRVWSKGAYLRFIWFGFWDFVLAITVRYGRMPLLAAVWLIGFWLVGWAVFAAAASDGAIKPNNTGVLRSEPWMSCGSAASQLDCYLIKPEAASYRKFNAAIYSVDTLLPIIRLEMQEHWTPDETKGFVGRSARWYLWGQIAVGWALSLLAVAGFSGLIKTDTG